MLELLKAAFPWLIIGIAIAIFAANHSKAKKPIDMTDDECTLLAGIPNVPSVYSLDVNPDLAYQRQKKVIECMAECGYTK